MKKLLVIALCLCLASVAALAAVKANFSGSWTMDKSRNEGVPPDMEQTMTVTQQGDSVSVETKIITDQGDQMIASAYVLDGKEAEYPVSRAMGEGKGKRTAKWTADGNGFEVTEEEKVDTPNGQVTLKFARKWAMAADGKSLTIELDVASPTGKQHSKRIFVKK